MKPLGLPPLNALRAFDAVARRSSFKAAGEELFVTPTAISHQIRLLEEHLGVRLLDRSPRIVRLTVLGAELYEATAAGFATIGKAVARIRGVPDGATLTLSSTPAFLSQWMAPRMGDLRWYDAGIDLRLHASDAIVELNAGGIEAAIRYGEGPFAGVTNTMLCRDEFLPVCSPRLDVTSFDDLGRTPLIHIDGMTSPRPAPSWARWCEAAGIVDLDTGVGLRFPDSLLATQAAIAGLGVAIVSSKLAADALDSGLLTAPFNTSLQGANYYFTCAAAVGSRPDVVSLRNWFLLQMST